MYGEPHLADNPVCMWVAAMGWVGRRRGANLVLLFFAAAALFLPRPSVTPDSDGLILVVDSLRTLLGVAGVVLGVTITGSWVMKRLHRPSVPSLLELVAAFLIGSAVTGSVLMAAGLLGYFSPLAVRVLCIALPLVLLDWSTSTYLRETLGSAVREIRALGQPVGGRVVLLSHGVLALFLLLIALGPMISSDAATYHIGAPLNFLEEGSIYHLLNDRHLAFVSTFQMLNAVLLASVGQASVAVLHWVSLVLVVALVGVAGVRLGRPRIGWMAMALLWSAPILFRQGSDAMTDIYLVLSVLVVSLWVMTLNDAPSARGVMGLGLLAASAFLVKYQAGPYLIGAGLAFVVIKGSAWRGLNRMILTMSVVLPSLLLLPFLVKNYIFFGSSLYPFPFAGERLYPPWLAQSFDLTGPVNGSRSYRVTVSGRSEFTFTRWLFEPEVLSNHSEGRFLGYPLIFLAVPFAFRQDNWRTLWCLMLPALAGVLGVVAASPLTHPRYLLPVMPVGALLSSLAFDRTISVFLSGHRAMLAAGLVTCLAAWPASILLQHDLIEDRRYAVGVGVYSQIDWAEFSYQRGRVSYLRLHYLEEFLGDTVDQGETVLLLYDKRGAVYDVEVIQDDLYTNWPMLHDALQGTCLSPSVADYIVWNQDILDYLAEKGTDMSLVRREAFEEFSRECLKQVASLEGFSVYEVIPSQAPMAAISK